MGLNVGVTTDRVSGTFIGAEDIIQSGLMLHLDAGNYDSYIGSGTWNNLAGDSDINGTVTGATFSTDGYFTFDGSGDYIDCSDDSSLAIAQDLTLAFWTYLTAYGDDWEAWSGRVDDDTINEWNFRHNGESGQFYFGNGAARVLSWDLGDNGLSLNAWHYLVGVRDFNGSDTMYVNIDTVPGSSTSLAGLADASASSERCIIGASTDGPGAPFIGRIAIAQIYKKALTQSEILHNFNVDRGRFGV